MTDLTMDVETVVSKGAVVLTKVTTNRQNQVYYVQPAPGGFGLYQITVEKGFPPKELTSLHTKKDLAVDAIRNYLQTAKQSLAAWEKERKQNASKPKRDSKEHVHSGADN